MSSRVDLNTAQPEMYGVCCGGWKRQPRTCKRVNEMHIQCIFISNDDVFKYGWQGSIE